MSSPEPSEPALIAPLMRVLWQEARDHIHEALASSEFHDVRAEHLSILQNPGPDGERPSALAARTGMSRQAINHLVGHLERAGYLERHRDPSDGSARLIFLTSRGRRLVRHIAAAARALEREWAKDLGHRRLEGARTSLAELAGAREARGRARL